MSNLFMFLLLGVVQLATAAWGGIVSVKALPTGENKLPHIWGFLVMGALGLLLTVGIGVANYQSDQEGKRREVDYENKQEALGDKLSSSLQRSEYMRGQLETIGQMVSKIGNKTTDPALGQMAGAIAKMAESGNHAPLLGSPLADLKAKALAIANRLRLFGGRYSLQRGVQPEDRVEFITLRGEAAIVREQVRNLYEGHPELETESVSNWFVVGSDPQRAISMADYLEKLAHDLPDKAR